MKDKTNTATQRRDDEQMYMNAVMIVALSMTAIAALATASVAMVICTLFVTTGTGLALRKRRADLVRLPALAAARIRGQRP